MGGAPTRDDAGYNPTITDSTTKSGTSTRHCETAEGSLPTLRLVTPTRALGRHRCPPIPCAPRISVRNRLGSQKRPSRIVTEVITSRSIARVSAT